jgi:hypothetical protein
MEEGCQEKPELSGGAFPGPTSPTSRVAPRIRQAKLGLQIGQLKVITACLPSTSLVSVLLSG